MKPPEYPWGRSAQLSLSRFAYGSFKELDVLYSSLSLGEDFASLVL
ncbi:hypothetical protein [Cohnella soli]|uniref:Uncharacterized protein n=1 Tax=Cohnella soli TaxID=425005 RepID=A0ABW0HTG2_9BACL